MREVLRTPYYRAAVKEMRFHAAPIENPIPLGPPQLTYRVEKTGEGYSVVGYTDRELRRLADA